MWKPFLLALMVLSFFTSPPPIQKKIIYPPGSKAGGNWSPGVLMDGTLYVSGMGGEDAAGKVPDNFEAEVQQSLDNIGACLKPPQCLVTMSSASRCT